MEGEAQRLETVARISGPSCNGEPGQTTKQTVLAET